MLYVTTSLEAALSAKAELDYRSERWKSGMFWICLVCNVSRRGRERETVDVRDREFGWFEEEFGCGLWPLLHSAGLAIIFRLFEESGCGVWLLLYRWRGIRADRLIV